MAERVLVDNDVAIKAAAYALVDEFLSATTVEQVPPALLGVARFVIRGRLSRATNIRDKVAAQVAFERLLEAVGFIEPDEAELQIAADLEAEAIRRDLELDGGESQLLAVLANRFCDLLLTGDKRAISAMAAVAPTKAAARIACLEQLMAHIARTSGATATRPRVCAEPAIDRAITICFGCSRENASTEDVLAALASYTAHLNSMAPGVLLPGDDLASLVM